MRRLPSTGLCYLVLTCGNLTIKHEIAFTLSGTLAESQSSNLRNRGVVVRIGDVGDRRHRGTVVKSNEVIEIPFPPFVLATATPASTVKYALRTFCRALILSSLAQVVRKAGEK